jgi:hypothetical protein
MEITQPEMRTVLYQHIDWDRVDFEVEKSKGSDYRLAATNQKVTKAVNEDLRAVNMWIDQNIDWRAELFEQSNSHGIHFEMVNEYNEVGSEDDITNALFKL